MEEEDVGRHKSSSGLEWLLSSFLPLGSRLHGPSGLPGCTTCTTGRGPEMGRSCWQFSLLPLAPLFKQLPVPDQLTSKLLCNWLEKLDKERKQAKIWLFPVCKLPKATAVYTDIYICVCVCVYHWWTQQSFLLIFESRNWNFPKIKVTLRLVREYCK